MWNNVIIAGGTGLLAYWHRKTLLKMALVGGVVAVGFTVLDSNAVTRPVAVWAGWVEDRGIIKAIPENIGWDKEVKSGIYLPDDIKKVVIRLTNTTPAPYRKFTLTCKTDGDDIMLLDETGIEGSVQAVLRSYKIDSTVGAVRSCQTLMVARGKPLGSMWDRLGDLDQWGARRPMTDVMLPVDTD